MALYRIQVKSTAGVPVAPYVELASVGVGVRADRPLRTTDETVKAAADLNTLLEVVTEDAGTPPDRRWQYGAPWHEPISGWLDAAGFGLEAAEVGSSAEWASEKEAGGRAWLTADVNAHASVDYTDGVSDDPLGCLECSSGWAELYAPRGPWDRRMKPYTYGHAYSDAYHSAYYTMNPSPPPPSGLPPRFHFLRSYGTARWQSAVRVKVVTPLDDSSSDMDLGPVVRWWFLSTEPGEAVSNAFEDITAFFVKDGGTHKIIVTDRLFGEPRVVASLNFDWENAGWFSIVLLAVRSGLYNGEATDPGWMRVGVATTDSGSFAALSPVFRSQWALRGYEGVALQSTTSQAIRFDDYVLHGGLQDTTLDWSADTAEILPHPRLAYRHPVAARNDGTSLRVGLLGENVDLTVSAGLNQEPWKLEGGATFLDCVDDTAGAKWAETPSVGVSPPDGTDEPLFGRSVAEVDFFADDAARDAFVSGKDPVFAHAGYIAARDATAPGHPFGRRPGMNISWLTGRSDDMDVWETYWQGNPQWWAFRASAAIPLDTEALEGEGIPPLPYTAEVVGESAIDSHVHLRNVWAVYGYR